MDSNKNLDLSRKAYPYDENLRVAYMLGLKEGYDQAMQDFLEKASKYLFDNLSNTLDITQTVSFIDNFKIYMQDESN